MRCVLWAGLALLLLGSACGQAPVDATCGGAVAQPGDPAPDQLPDCPLEPFADGPEVALADYRGTPMVLNFWAAWCEPCRDEMPDLQSVHEAAGDRVAFLGVDTMDAALNAEPFAEDAGITYDLATDRAGALYTAIGGFGMPTTLLVDADGAIQWRQTGPVDAAGLRELIEEHLGITI